MSDRIQAPLTEQLMEKISEDASRRLIGLLSLNAVRATRNILHQIEEHNSDLLPTEVGCISNRIIYLKWIDSGRVFLLEIDGVNSNQYHMMETKNGWNLSIQQLLSMVYDFA